MKREEKGHFLMINPGPFRLFFSVRLVWSFLDEFSHLKATPVQIYTDLVVFAPVTYQAR